VAPPGNMNFCDVVEEKREVASKSDGGSTIGSPLANQKLGKTSGIEEASAWTPTSLHPPRHTLAASYHPRISARILLNCHDGKRKHCSRMSRDTSMANGSMNRQDDPFTSKFPPLPTTPSSAEPI
jgi:hypothetical protein